MYYYVILVLNDFFVYIFLIKGYFNSNYFMLLIFNEILLENVIALGNYTVVRFVLGVLFCLELDLLVGRYFI